MNLKSVSPTTPYYRENNNPYAPNFWGVKKEMLHTFLCFPTEWTAASQRESSLRRKSFLSTHEHPFPLSVYLVYELGIINKLGLLFPWTMCLRRRGKTLVSNINLSCRIYPLELQVFKFLWMLVCLGDSVVNLTEFVIVVGYGFDRHALLF